MNSVVDEFSSHPTLLKIPVLQRPGQSTEEILPLPPAEYVVRVSDGWWFVVERNTGAMVYAGLGRVAIEVSRAPF